MRVIRLLGMIVMMWTAGPGPAAAGQTVAFSFQWQGEGGYEMRGALSFPTEKIIEQLIFENDIECFYIEGLQDGKPIGRWGLAMLEEGTTWRLTFDPVLEEFAVWGQEFSMPQAWNMDGAGSDCGPGGFGFNIGNAAQDLCLDGQLLYDSQVEPARPFPAERADGHAFPADACRGVMMMSRAGGW